MRASMIFSARIASSWDATLSERRSEVLEVLDAAQKWVAYIDSQAQKFAAGGPALMADTAPD